MTIFLIVYLFLIPKINPQKSICKDFNIRPFVTCYQYFLQKCLIVEGNQEEYQQLDQIDHQILNKSITIPYEGKPIQTKIINSLDDGKINNTLLCSLFLNTSYFITCIISEQFFQLEIIDQSKKFTSNINILSNEICDEFYNNNKGGFDIFCTNSFFFKQYEFYLPNNLTLSLQYELKDQIQNNCKKHQKQLTGNRYLIAFIECYKWIIILVNDQNVEIILEPKMIENDDIISNFSFIDDIIFYCTKKQLYLINKNNYLLVVYGSSSQNQNYFSFSNTRQILKIVPLSLNQNVLLVTLQQLNTSNENESSKEITLNQLYSYNNIHFESNMLFIQNKSDLIVMIDNHLNQTYGIIDSQLHFLDIYNLIYQIDQTNQVIQFYEYLPIQSYLKPKLNKYLHLFEVQDQFKVKKQKQLCLKVLKDDNKEQSLLDSKIVLQNNCSTEIVSRKQSSILKPLNTIMNLQNKENDSIRVNIWNYDQITEPCYQKLQLLYFKEKIQIKFLELPFFILFQIGTSFCFYDCIQNIVAKSLNLEKFDVLQAYKSYYVIEKNTNYIQIIQALLKPFNIQSLYLDEVIINTQQLYQCIVIYMNNTKLPYLIKQKSYLGMYLNQNLYQPEKIVSYFDFTDIIFIQYPNLLALEIQGHIKTYQMQDILILRIKSYDSNRFFSILSIQLKVKYQSQTIKLILQFNINMKKSYYRVQVQFTIT